MRILCLFQRCGTNHRIYRGFRLQRFAEGEHWECAACGRQASVTAGTVMHGLKLPLFWAVYLMATHSNGIAAPATARVAGVGIVQVGLAGDLLASQGPSARRIVLLMSRLLQRSW
jgi:hypothetical protein